VTNTAIRLDRVRRTTIRHTSSSYIRTLWEAGKEYFEGTVATPFGIVVVCSEGGVSMDGTPWAMSYYRIVVNGIEYHYSEQVIRRPRGLARQAHRFASYVMEHEGKQ
jgi:hypothetical protein